MVICRYDSGPSKWVLRVANVHRQDLASLRRWAHAMLVMSHCIFNELVEALSNSPA